MAGIKSAVESGLSSLPVLDPFEQIDPMEGVNIELQTAALHDIQEGVKYVSQTGNDHDDDSDEEWIDPNNPDDGNIFDTFETIPFVSAVDKNNCHTLMI